VRRGREYGRPTANAFVKCGMMMSINHHTELGPGECDAARDHHHRRRSRRRA
jgi:hypothetical protein